MMSQPTSNSDVDEFEKPGPFQKTVDGFQKAAKEGFGTRARNVASRMTLGDTVVPLCSNIDQRQLLAGQGVYAGVEYTICSLTLANSSNVESLEGLPLEE
eukprot:12251247-Ditylum_brightwellii.AAC.1